MNTELSIIIVNWNGGALLTRCIETIVASNPRVTYEVVIVDNASTDNSLAELQKSEAGVHLASNQQLRIFNNTDNKGFGAANNQGFEVTDSPFVFLLNLDTEVYPGTIDTLMRTIHSNPGIGACGPKLLNPDGSLQISAYVNPPRVWHTVLSQLKLYYLLPPRIRGELLLGHHWNHERQRSVPMLGGAAILARRQMIEEVGGFDERFHMYAEDNEWCWRITRSEWKLVFVPDALVLHHGGTSSLKRWTSDEKLKVKLEAGFHFEHRVLPRWQLAANQLANYLVVSAQIAGRQVRGIHIPELYLIREMHREHLKRSLRNHLDRD